MHTYHLSRNHWCIFIAFSPIPISNQWMSIGIYSRSMILQSLFVTKCIPVFYNKQLSNHIVTNYTYTQTFYFYILICSSPNSIKVYAYQYIGKRRFLLYHAPLQGCTTFCIGASGPLPSRLLIPAWIPNVCNRKTIWAPNILRLM